LALPTILASWYSRSAQMERSLSGANK
jgi:hypothetical protein